MPLEVTLQGALEMKVLRTCFHHSRDAIVVLHRGHCIKCNKPACRLFGYQNLQEEPFVRYWTEHPKWTKAALKAPRTLFLSSFCRHDGSKFAGEVTIRVVNFDERHPLVLLIIRDTSDQQKLMGALQESKTALTQLTSQLAQLQDEALQSLSRELYEDVNQLLCALRHQLYATERRVNKMQESKLRQEVIRQIRFSIELAGRAQESVTRIAGCYNTVRT